MSDRTFKNISHVLCDIEGTTTPIHFVHEILFPYSAQHLRKFILEHRSNRDVLAEIAQVKETLMRENNLASCSDEDAVSALLKWISEDRKHPSLKKIQGMIWRDGFEKREFVAPIYPDVFPAIKKWHAKGIWVGIYSSGSVEAQKLLFAHTNEGDLLELLKGYFDTSIGGKRETQSYKNICAQLETSAQNILFLSDIAEELNAAREAGVQAIQVVRDEKTKRSNNFSSVESFAQLILN